MTLNDLEEFGEDIVLLVAHIPLPPLPHPTPQETEKSRPLGTFQLLCSLMVKNSVQGWEDGSVYKSLLCKQEDLHLVSTYTQDVVGAGGRSQYWGGGGR